MLSIPIIKSVAPLHASQFLFVRIETESGVVGWGESGVFGHIEAGATAVSRFAEYLVGKPTFDIEYHWNVMHRFSYFQGMAINAAISGIDALWDIKGKVHGVPVWKILGGACLKKARVYGQIYEKTIEGVLEECKKKIELGYTAFGHINPFFDEGHDQVHFKTHVKKMQDARSRRR
jgi:galactonate dehydratase